MVLPSGEGHDVLLHQTALLGRHANDSVNILGADGNDAGDLEVIAALVVPHAAVGEIGCGNADLIAADAV